MINKKFKVAVLNYPLMDPRLKIIDFGKYFDLEYTNVDPWHASLYIHIPFCSKICKFCVYSRRKLNEASDVAETYVNALIKEIGMYGRTAYIKSLKIGAVFVGGGTPSCLSADQLEKIISACKSFLPLTSEVEITVECNIMNANHKKVHRLYEMGVTRISAGIQTFNPFFRKVMGLETSESAAVEWVMMAKHFPFAVVSIDLIYGLPGQIPDEWVQDMKTGLSLPVDHFSIYELYVLSGSMLYNDIKSGHVPACPDQSLLFEMYVLSNRMLEDNGYEHHIVPEYNFKGKRSRFWELTYDGYGDNLAMGASSFGFINGVTYQNTPKISSYIKYISEDRYPIGMVGEKATHLQMMERTMALGLRRRYIEKNIFKEQYGRTIADVFGKVIDVLKHERLLVEEADSYRLTAEGEFVQGDISVMFMKSTLQNVTGLKKQIAIGKHIVPEAIKTGLSGGGY